MIAETATPQAAENAGQYLRQPGLARGVRDNHRRCAGSARLFGDGLTIQWLIEGGADNVAGIGTVRRGRRSEWPHAQTSQVEGYVVRSVRKFDNHLCTIAFWIR